MSEYIGLDYYFAILFLINALFHVYKIKNPAQFFLALWLLSASCIFFYHGMYESKLLLKYPAFFGAIALTPCVAVPSFFISFYYALNRGQKWNNLHLLHFIPLFVRIIFLLPLYQMDLNEKIPLITRSLETRIPEQIPGESAYILMSYHFCYIIMTIFVFRAKVQWRLLFKDFKRNRNVRNPFQIILIWGWLHVLLYSYYMSLDMATHEGLYEIVKIITGSDSFLIIIFFQTFPYLQKLGFLKTDPDLPYFRGYLKSYLNNTDLEKLKQKLNDWRLQKIYLNPELSVADAAQQLNVSSHQLSEYCNVYLHCPFRDFINNLRLEEAKHQLLAGSEKNITHICLNAGFNSTASFYRIFKKSMGITPEEYRIQQARIIS